MILKFEQDVRDRFGWKQKLREATAAKRKALMCNTIKECALLLLLGMILGHIIRLCVG
jgi:hypothetical protein